MTFKSPFNQKYALTDNQMINFCKKHDINANVIELDEFNKNPDIANLFFIIYTGSEPNEYNTLKPSEKKHSGEHYTLPEQPITHHWLGGHGNKIFDSYGYYGDYKWPEGIEGVTTIPSRLQEYDSDVCGLYVLAFLKFCSTTKEHDNIGFDFSNEHGFTNNRNENDESIIKWYEENK
jgi:hypothetical protein